MQKGAAATDHAGGEAELADQCLEILDAAGAVGEQALHRPQQVEASVVVDGDRAGHRVDDQAQVAQPRGRAGLLVGVAAQAEPLEDGHGGSHVLRALRRSGGSDDQVVHVHRTADPQGGQELDHLAGEAAGERRGHAEAEGHARAPTVRWVALAGGTAARLPLGPGGGRRPCAAPLRVSAGVPDPAGASRGRPEADRRVVLGQIRGAQQSVGELAQQRDGVVDTGHPKLPLRHAGVDAALRQVEDRTNGIRCAVALEGAVVRGPDYHVHGGAHGVGGQRPDAIFERVDLVHLVHVGDGRVPLVPAGLAVRHFGGLELAVQRWAEADADLLHHLALVALRVRSPEADVRRAAGPVRVAQRSERRRVAVLRR